MRRVGGCRCLWVGLVWLLLQGCAVGATLTAQSPSPRAELDRIEAAADSGKVSEAREGLERWFRTATEDTPREEMSRARFLRARLTADADSARSDYLWVAIDGGTDRGAAAWLKLAQLDLMQGDPERALLNLARLRDDYPGSALVPVTWFWAGMAHAATGRLEEACRAWDRATGLAAREGDRDTEERSRDAWQRCEAGELRLTVQVGAFRSADAAEDVRARLQASGFDARVDRSGDLHRVRVGRFGATESAREAAERLEQAGFSAYVVVEDS